MWKYIITYTVILGYSMPVVELEKEYHVVNRDHAIILHGWFLRAEFYERNSDMAKKTNVKLDSVWIDSFGGEFKKLVLPGVNPVTVDVEFVK